MEAVQTADLVVVMDAGQAMRLVRSFGASLEKTLVLGDLDPEPIQRRTITDPVDLGEDVFADTYARIDRCIRVLVDSLYPL
jgi:protein-tyrosine-phosphatase